MGATSAEDGIIWDPEARLEPSHRDETKGSDDAHIDNDKASGDPENKAMPITQALF